MPYNEILAGRIRRTLARRSDITECKMFGGVAFLCNGRMCCGVAGSDLVVRIVESEMLRALARPHVRPMDLTGRPLRGFVFVSPPACRTAASLNKWIAGGLRFVQQNYATETAVVGPTRVRVGARAKSGFGRRKIRRTSRD
jgi:TfoX/Sxy family transcriptional regulator of competence genes